MKMIVNPFVYDLANVLWAYLVLDTPLERADAIIGFGSYNTEVPKRAAELFRQGYAARIVFTGNLGKGTVGIWARTEAETFHDIAVQCGVPSDAILVESRATNTGENIAFTKALLCGTHIQSIIAVHKAYMTRRIYAALKKQWPEVRVMTAHPACSLQTYIASQTGAGVPEAEIIHSLVGDFQRMDVFAQRGYQIEMDIPREAWAAYHELVALGFSKYIV